MKDDSSWVGVLFYRREPDSHNNYEVVHRDFCKQGTSSNCPGQLPSGISGSICMKTSVGNDSDPTKYQESDDYRCFGAGPQNEGASR